MVFDIDKAAPPTEENEDPKYSSGHQGYGFVCFTRCEDARKALEHFHEKGDESSVSIDVHSGSKGADDSNAPAASSQV